MEHELTNSPSSNSTPSLSDSKVTELLLEAKHKRNLTFKEIGDAIGRSEVWVAALFYCQATASMEEATKLLDVLKIEDIQLTTTLLKSLKKYPLRGTDAMAERDPFVHRLLEAFRVYGLPIKAVVNEKFGDGIISAIDCIVKVDERIENDQKRVVVTVDGKFLPFRKW